MDRLTGKKKYVSKYEIVKKALQSLKRGPMKRMSHYLEIV